MTLARDLSKIMDSILRESRFGVDGLSTLLRTMDMVWYGSTSRKEKGTFFCLNDIAFDVPELQAFRQFAVKLREPPFELTNGFAILDYSLPRLPKDYINAIYLLLDESRNKEIAKYAGRLTGLYKYSQIADRIFDSNKVILSHRHYESFILSRAASRSDRIEDEYFIDLAQTEQLLKDLLNGEIDRLLTTDGAAYLEALANLYETVRSENYRDKIPPILRSVCSPLICDVVLEEPQTRNVGGQEFADVQSSFVTYLVFFLSIMPSSPEEFVYFPVQMVAGADQTLRWVGGALLPLLKSSTREQRVALKSAVQVIVSSFYSAYTDALLLESLEAAAQAQIMSRNMSHNIGSHALARINASHMRDNPEDAERLLSYLQERMDFVARVATKWPSWREPVLFYGDLIHGFLKQGMLLNNLVADDGYTADKIIFYVALPEASVMCFTYPMGNCTRDDKYSEFCDSSRDSVTGQAADLLVSIPGGPVGRQAFYGFLENAIRNAAKHNPGCQSLKIFLKLSEHRAKDGLESRFYQLTYKDSVSLIESDSKLVDRVQSYLKEDLVNPKSRKPIDHAWGLQEMKLYARYLAHPFENEKDPFLEQQGGVLLSAKDEGLTTANTEEGEGVKNQAAPRVLSYSFGLQRPCLALLISSCGLPTDEQTRRRFGLQSFDQNWEALEPGLVHHISPALLYFDDISIGEDTSKFLSFLKANRKILPARVLLRTSNNDDCSKLRALVRDNNLSHRVRVDSASLSLGSGCEDLRDERPEIAIQRCLINLFRRWLVALTEERGFEIPLNIIVYFDRADSPYPQHWANLRRAASLFGVDDLINVFPVGKQNVSSSPGSPAKITLEPWSVVTRSWDDQSKKLCDSLEVGDQRGSWLVFDNHRRGKPDSVNTSFYQHLGAHLDNETPHPNNREAFDRMTNVPEGFAGLLSLLQLAEACLLRVLVLDERVAGLALELERSDQVRSEWSLTWKKTKGGTEYGDKLTGHFGDAGVCFSPFFDVNEEGKVKHICLLPTEGSVKWLNHNDGALFPSLTIRGSEVTNCVVLGLNGESIPTLIPISNCQTPFFDAAIIHKGLLERLAESVDHFNQQLFLESLDQFAARVILTSGRGAQMEDDLAGYPFVEFAVLESYLVRELSKASLANVIMAVTGQER